MNSDDGSELFRGHVEECLQHYAAQLASQIPKGSKGANKVKEPMGEFCDVLVPTVARWLAHPDRLPQGDILIKMMCFLDTVGYRVIELERLAKGIRQFAELIAYGVISAEEAFKELGYSTSSGLYRILLGGQKASEERKQKMFNIRKGKMQTLEKKKEEARQKYVLQRMPESPPLLPEVIVRMRDHRAVYKIMEGLSMLLEGGGFDDALVEYLKDAPPQAIKVVMGLSVHLTTLSSRLIIENKPKGGET